jgi:NADP-dependent 3-hydroxy acid dehydrogenase YdfG
MSKKILVLGASKGIGAKCAEHFQGKGHSIITVARSGNMTLNGDVAGPAFRNQILALDVDVVINCIGGWGDQPYTHAMHVNSGVAIDLMMRFYDRLPVGSHIINISSLAGNFTSGWANMPAERIVYMASKQAMSAATTALAQSKRRDVRVTTIEPGEVHPTSFGPTKNVPAMNYTDYQFESFTPYRPQDIADVIDWVISSPPWFGISKITLNNHCKKG